MSKAKPTPTTKQKIAWQGAVYRGYEALAALDSAITTDAYAAIAGGSSKTIETMINNRKFTVDFAPGKTANSYSMTFSAEDKNDLSPADEFLLANSVSVSRPKDKLVFSAHVGEEMGSPSAREKEYGRKETMTVGTDFTPRAHQLGMMRDYVNQISKEKNIENGNHALFVMGTGTGKTIAQALLVSGNPGGQIFVVPDETLLVDTLKDVPNLLQEKDKGKIMQYHEGIVTDLPDRLNSGAIVMMTAPQLMALQKQNPDLIHGRQIYIDEVHQWAENDVKLTALRDIGKNNNICGFTATPSPALSSVFKNKPVCEIGLKEAKDMGGIRGIEQKVEKVEDNKTPKEMAASAATSYFTEVTSLAKGDDGFYDVAGEAGKFGADKDKIIDTAIERNLTLNCELKNMAFCSDKDGLEELHKAYYTGLQESLSDENRATLQKGIVDQIKAFYKQAGQQPDDKVIIYKADAVIASRTPFAAKQNSMDGTNKALKEQMFDDMLLTYAYANLTGLSVDDVRKMRQIKPTELENTVHNAVTGKSKKWSKVYSNQNELTADNIKLETTDKTYEKLDELLNDIITGYSDQKKSDKSDIRKEIENVMKLVIAKSHDKDGKAFVKPVKHQDMMGDLAKSNHVEALLNIAQYSVIVQTKGVDKDTQEAEKKKAKAMLTLGLCRHVLNDGGMETGISIKDVRSTQHIFHGDGTKDPLNTAAMAAQAFGRSIRASYGKAMGYIVAPKNVTHLKPDDIMKVSQKDAAIAMEKQRQIDRKAVASNTKVYVEKIQVKTPQDLAKALEEIGKEIYANNVNDWKGFREDFGKVLNAIANDEGVSQENKQVCKDIHQAMMRNQVEGFFIETIGDLIKQLVEAVAAKVEEITTKKIVEADIPTKTFAEKFGRGLASAERQASGLESLAHKENGKDKSYYETQIDKIVADAVKTSGMGKA